MNDAPEQPAASPGMALDADASVYDRAEALARIADDEELFNDLVDMFLGNADAYMDDIRQAIARGDMAALQQAAHTLKGILATFSAAPAQAQALELEQAGRDHQSALTAPVLERLEREMARLLPVLKHNRKA